MLGYRTYGSTLSRHCHDEKQKEIISGFGRLLGFDEIHSFKLDTLLSLQANLKLTMDKI